MLATALETLQDLTQHFPVILLQELFILASVS